MTDRRYFTLIIKTQNADEILSLVSAAVSFYSEVELEFVCRPAPTQFKEILLLLKKNISTDKWFLSETDGIIAGTLFNLNFSRPRRASIEIANGCNLKCDFCWTHSPLLKTPHDPAWLKSSLKTESVKKYIDELKSFGTVRIIELSGVGDPLYHPDIWEILDYAKSNGFAVRLCTNGTLLLPDKWDALNANVDELFLNISAGDRETYAEIHNVHPRIFDQLMLNLKHIHTQREKKNQKLTIHWINIITEKNVGNIPEMIAAGLEIRADYFDFRHVWTTFDFLKSISLSENVLSRHKESLIETKNRLVKSGVSTNYQDFYKHLYNEEPQHYV